MSDEPEYKYPDLKNASRIERDNAIFQQLEILSNELARISKVVSRIETKI